MNATDSFQMWGGFVFDMGVDDVNGKLIWNATPNITNLTFTTVMLNIILLWLHLITDKSIPVIDSHCETHAYIQCLDKHCYICDIKLHNHLCHFLINKQVLLVTQCLTKNVPWSLFQAPC